MGREWYKKTMILLVVLLTVIIKVQEVVGGLECINGTSSSSSIGDCLPDEFLMESETSSMILAGNPRQVQRTSYKVTTDRPPLCNEKIYGNCLNSPNLKSTYCNYGNRCKHTISN